MDVSDYMNYMHSSPQSSSNLGDKNSWKKLEAYYLFRQEDLPKRPSSVNYHSDNSATRVGNMITTKSKQEYGEYGYQTLQQSSSSHTN